WSSGLDTSFRTVRLGGIRHANYTDTPASHFPSMLGFKRIDTRPSQSAASNWRKRSRRLNSRRENWRVDRPQRRQSGWLFWPPKAKRLTTCEALQSSGNLAPEPSNVVNGKGWPKQRRRSRWRWNDAFN